MDDRRMSLSTLAVYRLRSLRGRHGLSTTCRLGPHAGCLYGGRADDPAV